MKKQNFLKNFDNGCGVRLLSMTNLSILNQ
jgi:hypothetical protein